MNDFVATLTRWLLRAVVLAMGLVLFLSLLAAALVLGLAWALRATWAKLTGRPMTPWVMRVDPRTGFSAAMRSTGRWGAARPAGADVAAPDEAPGPSRRGGVLPGSVEVTDVEPRELR